MGCAPNIVCCRMKKSVAVESQTGPVQIDEAIGYSLQEFPRDQRNPESLSQAEAREVVILSGEEGEAALPARSKDPDW